MDYTKEKLLKRRLGRLAPGGRAMILAYDQGFEHGPRDFLKNPDSSNFEYILGIAGKGGFTGLVVHWGLAEKYNKKILDSDVGLILKLNGKSELYTEDDPYSPQLYSVEDAMSLGATAVGYTVYSGSKYENQMNKEFARIVREAHCSGLPVIGWMYPRGRGLHGESKTTTKALEEMVERGETNSDKIDEMPAMVAYGARLGLELGADIVKVKWTGSVESFKWVVDCAKPTKVVMSGGPETETEEEFLERVRDVLKAGGVGIAVGRNVWQRKNALEISEKLRKIILNKARA